MWNHQFSGRWVYLFLFILLILNMYGTDGAKNPRLNITSKVLGKRVLSTSTLIPKLEKYELVEMKAKGYRDDSDDNVFGTPLQVQTVLPLLPSQRTGYTLISCSF